MTALDRLAVNSRARAVLVADNEPAHVQAIRRACQGADPPIVVRAVGSLSAYLSEVSVQPPDVAIVDLGLPDGRATDVLAHRPGPESFPVLVMTASGDEQTAVAAIKAGAIDYIVKSADVFADMPHIIDRALREWRLTEERSRAEAALRRNEERFRRLAENAADIVYRYRLGEHRGFEYVSPSATRITGYTPDEHYADPDLGDKLVHRDDRRRLATLQDGFAGPDEPVVLRWVAKSGRIVWTEQHNVLIHNDAGQVIAVEGIARDVTERVAGQEALTASEERFRLLFDGARDAIVWADAETGLVTHCNRAAETLLGRDRAEIVGHPQTVLYPTDEAADYGPLLDRRAAMGPSARRDAEIVRKDGHHIHVEIAPSVTVVGGRKVIQSILWDLTERKRAEADKLELERRLLHAQKLESLGILAGGIAHDFNNLLMVMLGHLDLARRDLSPASPVLPSIERAIQATRRATDLTNQMLAYSGKGRFTVARMDLSQVARENANLFRAATARTCMLNVHLAPLELLIEADAGQVQQVIMNLITNASDAIGDQPGVITLTTGAMDCDAECLSRSRVEEKPQPGRFAYVEVSDSGCGMSQEVMDRLFDPFFTTKFAGRGLGMAAVLGILRGHKGAITVDSAPGRGTTIRVLFPACETRERPDALEGTSGRPATAAPTTPSGVVLVVDDEDAVRELCCEFVQRLGYEAVAAAGGQEAVRLLGERADEHLCVILDLTMPGMHGAEAFRAMRQIRPDIRVILSSGYTEQVAMQEFGEGRSVGFLQKPYRLQTLKATLDKAFEA